MYVCICNAIAEKDIHAAVAEGIDSFENYQKRLLFLSVADVVPNMLVKQSKEH